MATVSLKGIQKVYPHSEPQKKKKKQKKEDQPVEEKKYKLKGTDEGVVAVDNSKDRDIAMVFQNYALYPHMTVRQNLEFPLKLRKVPKEEMDRRVNEAAEILGIIQFLDRKPKALSGGQRQRVAIGRAIVREPKVLLMDEPLSNLDAKLRNQMRAEIIKLRHRINTTFIYVTHDQTEAMTLGDRIVIMKDGEVQQIGTPQEVFDKPINTFVAGFIGMPRMNMFGGDLIKKDGKYYVQVMDACIELSPEKQKNLADRNTESRPVAVGCRPEHISLDYAEGKMIEGVVEVSEMMGSSVHLHLNSLGRDCIIIVPTLDLKDNSALQQGANVKFTFAPNAIHVFDPETGMNLEYL